MQKSVFCSFFYCGMLLLLEPLNRIKYLIKINYEIPCQIGWIWENSQPNILIILIIELNFTLNYYIITPTINKYLTAVKVWLSIKNYFFKN